MKYSSMVNHKIAVVGASGFVGTYLTQFLRNHFTDVFEFSRNAGDRPKLSNIIEIGDILSRNDYTGMFEEIETVVYTIGRAHVANEEHLDFELIYKKINCDAMIRIAKAAQSQGVKRFIFLSSLKAIGEGTSDRPFSNKSIPEPEGPYGKSKLMAEKALLDLSDSTGLEVVIIRPPLIHGPGVKGNLRSIQLAIRKRVPLPLKCVSKNSRSLVSLENLSSLLKECVLNPAAKNNIFLVKDEHDLSTVEIVKMLAQEEDIKPLLIPFPESLLRLFFFLVGKPWLSHRLFNNLTVDDTYTRQILDWSPTIRKNKKKILGPK